MIESELPDDALRVAMKDSDLEEENPICTYRALIRGRAIERGNLASELSAILAKANAQAEQHPKPTNSTNN